MDKEFLMCFKELAQERIENLTKNQEASEFGSDWKIELERCRVELEAIEKALRNFSSVG